MLNKECADGDDAEEGVQFAPEEGVSLASAERLNTLGKFGRGGMVDSGHMNCSSWFRTWTRTSGSNFDSDFVKRLGQGVD